MNNDDEKWEERINALLDGELSTDDAEQLKAEALDNRDLARAIVEAYQLQQAMDAVRVEPAPAGLRKRLRAIPRKHRATPVFGFLQPRWAMALAVIPLVVISVSLMQPDTPSASEVAKARQDLAIAFAYLEKASNRVGYEIESTVGDTMSDAVAGTVIRNITSQNQLVKEKKV